MDRWVRGASAGRRVTLGGGLMAVCMVCFLGASTMGQTIHVNGATGDDTKAGTAEQPLRSLTEAVRRINAKTEAGPTTVRVAPGTYVLREGLVLDPSCAYTREARLTLEALHLPDDPSWTASLMPTVVSSEEPHNDGNAKRTETYSITVKTSHVTIRGFRFLGNPTSNNWHAVIGRGQAGLEDLVISQCAFVGGVDGRDIYCGVVGCGDELVVTHCVFLDCHNSVVFWDGPDKTAGKRNAMTHCIVSDGRISGVWTCGTADDFSFHHNVITRCDFVWIRKPGDATVYEVHDCVFTGNRHHTGYGGPAGPFQTMDEPVPLHQTNVSTGGESRMKTDPNHPDYLRLAPGSAGGNLGAGLQNR